jgi:hypothetical protein
LDEPAVVVGFLVVADQDRPAFLEPGECALDDPAAGGVRLLAGPVELLFADPSDVRDLAGGLGCRVAGRVVVGLVETEVLRALLRVWSLDDDRVDRPGEQLRVVHVCAVDLNAERPA